MEEWKTYKTIEVSNQGRVRTVRNGINYGSGTQGKNQYKRVSVNGKTHCVHQLVAELFIGKPEGRDMIVHMNGNKYDNRADNLQYVSRSDIRVKVWSTKNRTTDAEFLREAAKDRHVAVTDSNGVEYISIKEAASANGISVVSLHKSLRLGVPVRGITYYRQ